MRPKNLELVYIVGNSWQNARKWYKTVLYIMNKNVNDCNRSWPN